MSINAKIILDSITSEGKRLTTFQVRYPRYIHSELLTHRVFSRNASSSRAIPVKRVLEDIRKDPAMPVHWGKNQPGMQAEEELTGWKLFAIKKLWMAGMYATTALAGWADKVGAHKQIVNRMIEPWSHINVVITSSNWSNFFALRAHPDAQPEIKALADAMKAEFENSIPKLLQPGEWHLPYIRPEDIEAAKSYIDEKGELFIQGETSNDMLRIVGSPLNFALIGVSVARCARTSYKLHDGTETTFEKDFALYNRLLASVPLHASPAEHQAVPDSVLGGVFHSAVYEYPEYHGNFDGWIQYRKLLPGECQ